MLYGFNVALFDSYTRIHHQADKTPNKNYYTNDVVLFYIIRTYS
jgi:hypothetical protein